MSSEVVPHEESFRQCLSLVVASLCLEANYESAEEPVIETLTEMLQSCKLARIFYFVFQLLGSLLIR